MNEQPKAGASEFFNGSVNKDDQVSLFRTVGALGREEVWRGHVKDLQAARAKAIEAA